MIFPWDLWEVEVHLNRIFGRGAIPFWEGNRLQLLFSLLRFILYMLSLLMLGLLRRLQARRSGSDTFVVWNVSYRLSWNNNLPQSGPDMTDNVFVLWPRVKTCKMSSTLAPKIRSPNNPITTKDVIESLAKLGVEERLDIEGYTSMLTGMWEIWNNVDQMEDYTPKVDEERFPRTDSHTPTPSENPYNAWAWKVTIKDTSTASSRGLLHGKTVCIKVKSYHTFWQGIGTDILVCGIG